MASLSFSCLLLLVLCGSLIQAAVDNYDYMYTAGEENDVEIRFKQVGYSYLLIKVKAVTNGWIGLGFSNNSTVMDGTDMVIGWVDPTGAKKTNKTKDNKTGKMKTVSVDAPKAFVSDRKGKGHAVPVKDKKQNWKAMNGKYENGKLEISMQRRLQNCDKKDFKFMPGNINILWAIGDERPKNVDDIQRHSRRGVIKQKPVLKVSKTRKYICGSAVKNVGNSLMIILSVFAFIRHHF